MYPMIPKPDARSRFSLAQKEAAAFSSLALFFAISAEALLENHFAYTEILLCIHAMLALQKLSVVA